MMTSDLAAKLLQHNDSRQRWLQSLLVLAIFGVTAILAVLNGSFYDDEIFTIQQVTANGVLSLIHIMNSTDVHPPGAYVINRFLFDVLGGRWDLLKMADGLINGLGLASFYWIAWPKLAPRVRLYLLCLLATATTLVLWGTSVRWYAYYNPLFMVTLAVLLFSDMSRNARAMALCGAGVLLFHINYVAFCSVPVLLAAHLTREWSTLRRSKHDLAFLLVALCVAFALCVPQLIIFLTVHLKSDIPEQGSAASSLLQTATILGLGSAVFPLAPLPLLTAAVIAVGGLYALMRPLQAYERIALVALVTGLLLMTLSGLGARPRNAAYLLPLVWLLIASLLAKLPRVPQLVTAIIVACFQLLGLKNVIAHEGTSKGSYNTDFSAVLGQLEHWHASCGGRFVVFTHDVVVSDMLRRAAMTQSSPFSSSKPNLVRLSRDDCYAVVKTYHEPFSRTGVDKLYRATEVRDAAKIASADVSPDGNYRAKSWLRHEAFSPYYAHVDLYRVKGPVTLDSWEFPGWN